MLTAENAQTAAGDGAGKNANSRKSPPAFTTPQEYFNSHYATKRDFQVIDPFE
jgi:hypothetical protein